jgi:hypothetical protein
MIVIAIMHSRRDRDPGLSDYTIRSQGDGRLQPGLLRHQAAVAGNVCPDGHVADNAGGAWHRGCGWCGNAAYRQYVSGVDLSGQLGTITITYAGPASLGQANAVLDAETLSLQPYLSPNADIVWRCGAATPPTGTGAVATDAAAIRRPIRPASHRDRQVPPGVLPQHLWHLILARVL